MTKLANKTVRLTIHILLFILTVFVTFIPEIVMSEVSDGKPFDFALLFKNKLFWFFVAAQFVYGILCEIINRFAKSSDEAIEREYAKLVEEGIDNPVDYKKAVESAYAEGTKKLIDTTVKFTENGNFYSAERCIDIMKKLEKQRKRG